jgi:hypothetical protein
MACQTDALAFDIVNVEHSDCSAADRSQAYKVRALPSEVLVPLLGTWVEKRHCLAG